MNSSLSSPRAKVSSHRESQQQLPAFFQLTHAGAVNWSSTVVCFWIAVFRRQ